MRLVCSHKSLNHISNTVNNFTETPKLALRLLGNMVIFKVTFYNFICTILAFNSLKMKKVLLKKMFLKSYIGVFYFNFDSI